MTEKLVGTISDYFARPSVAGIDLSGTIKVGDRIKIVGHTTNLELIINSIQIEHHNIEEARVGESVGVKVPDRVRRGDSVYKVNGQEN